MQPINKSLTPEERAIVGNIKSLLTQLEGVVGEGTSVEMCEGAGKNPSTGTGITKADGAVGDPGSLDPTPHGATQKEPVSPFVAKDATGETGRNNAEEKIGELPVSTDEALGVLKALMSGGAVAKSASPSLAQIQKAQGGKSYAVENEMLKVMKSIAKRLDEQEFTLQALINGKEIAEEVLKIEKSAPRVPVQPSSQAILDALGQLVQKSAQTQSQPQSAGSMRDVLGTLWA